MQVHSSSTNPADATSATNGSTQAGSSSAAANAGGLNDPNLFISLLTAQLQAQSPLNPMSPTDMVNELTQVSSLQQLININQTLAAISKANSGTATTPANSTRN